MSEHTTQAHAQITCFLSSAERDSEMAAEVRSILATLNVRVQTVDDLPSASSVSSSLLTAVLSADFVCLVLSGTNPSPAVMYEAGLAAGTQRPLVVVVDSEAGDQLASDIISAPIIRHGPTAGKVLRDSLAAYVDRVQPIAVQLTVNWDPYIERILEKGHSFSASSERTIAGRVAGRLTALGALVDREARIGSRMADIVATIPTLGSAFNPIIIEIKSRSYAREASIRQVYALLQDARARLGMIIYGRDDVRTEVEIVDQFAFLLTSESEFMGWSDEQILSQITRLRNKVVHSA